MKKKRKNPYDNILTDEQVAEIKQDAFDAVKTGDYDKLFQILEKIKRFENRKPTSKKALEKFEEKLVNLF